HDGVAGIHVRDNTSKGHAVNVTGQLRKNFAAGLATSIGYSFTDARNQLKSTEIAFILWQNEPVQGDPNSPELGPSEFGQRHRIIGSATYSEAWAPRWRRAAGRCVLRPEDHALLDVAAPMERRRTTNSEGPKDRNSSRVECN